MHRIQPRQTTHHRNYNPVHVEANLHSVRIVTSAKCEVQAARSLSRKRQPSEYDVVIALDQFLLLRLRLPGRLKVVLERSSERRVEWAVAVLIDVDWQYEWEWISSQRKRCIWRVSILISYSRNASHASLALWRYSFFFILIPYFYKCRVCIGINYANHQRILFRCPYAAEKKC